MLDLQIYCIYDTERKEYWRTGKGKRVWLTKGAAKNAWNCDHPSREEAPQTFKVIVGYGGRLTSLVFNDQDRYQCHEVDVTDVTDCEIKVV